MAGAGGAPGDDSEQGQDSSKHEVSSSFEKDEWDSIPSSTPLKPPPRTPFVTPNPQRPPTLPPPALASPSPDGNCEIVKI